MFRRAIAPGVLLTVFLTAPVSGSGNRPVLTTSPWYTNRTGYLLRYGISPYSNPYYPFPATPPYRGPSSLVKPYRVPRLFLERERPAPEIDYYDRGRLRFFQARYDEAVRDWKQAALQQPKNGNLLLQLAQAQFQAGDYAAAVTALRRALAVLPKEKWKTVVVNRSLLYRGLEDYTARLRDLEQATRRKEKDAGLRLLLGYHLAFLGRTEEARRELNQAQKLAPTDETARQLRDLVTNPKP